MCQQIAQQRSTVDPFSPEQADRYFSPLLPYFFLSFFLHVFFFFFVVFLFFFLFFLFFLFSLFFSSPPFFPFSSSSHPPFSTGSFWTFLAAFTDSAILYISSLLTEDFEWFLFNMHVSAGLFVYFSFFCACICKAVYQTVPLHYFWRRAFVLA